MNLLDTYHLATFGQNSIDTYTLASNGVLVRVTIEDLEPVVPYVDPTGGIIPDVEETKIPRKRITVTATIEGKDHTQTLVVEDKPNLKLKDVAVDVTTTDAKPQITISVTI